MLEEWNLQMNGINRDAAVCHILRESKVLRFTVIFMIRIRRSAGKRRYVVRKEERHDDDDELV